MREPIHAPLTPSASKTSGPTQHIDAPMAENIPAIRKPFPLWVLDFFTSDIFLKKPVYAPYHSTESNRKSKNHWLAALTPDSRADRAEVQLFVVNSSEQQPGTSFLVSSLSSATGRSPFAMASCDASISLRSRFSRATFKRCSVSSSLRGFNLGHN